MNSESGGRVGECDGQYAVSMPCRLPFIPPCWTRRWTVQAGRNSTHQDRAGERRARSANESQQRRHRATYILLRLSSYRGRRSKEEQRSYGDSSECTGAVEDGRGWRRRAALSRPGLELSAGHGGWDGLCMQLSSAWWTCLDGVEEREKGIQLQLFRGDSLSFSSFDASPRRQQQFSVERNQDMGSRAWNSIDGCRVTIAWCPVAISLTRCLSALMLLLLPTTPTERARNGYSTSIHPTVYTNPEAIILLALCSSAHSKLTISPTTSFLRQWSTGRYASLQCDGVLEHTLLRNVEVELKITDHGHYWPSSLSLTAPSYGLRLSTMNRMNRLSTFANEMLNKVTPNARTRASALNFQDVSQFQSHPYQRMKDRVPSVSQLHPLEVYPKPLNLQRNKTERTRLQGIMQRKNRFNSMSTSNEQTGNRRNAFKRFITVESGKRTFFAVWIVLHALVFGLGMLHYQLKGEASLPLLVTFV